MARCFFFSSRSASTASVCWLMSVPLYVSGSSVTARCWHSGGRDATHCGRDEGCCKGAVAGRQAPPSSPAGQAGLRARVVLAAGLAAVDLAAVDLAAVDLAGVDLDAADLDAVDLAAGFASSVPVFASGAFVVDDRAPAVFEPDVFAAEDLRAGLAAAA